MTDISPDGYVWTRKTKGKIQPCLTVKEEKNFVLSLVSENRYKTFSPEPCIY